MQSFWRESNLLPHAAVHHLGENVGQAFRDGAALK